MSPLPLGPISDHLVQIAAHSPHLGVSPETFLRLPFDSGLESNTVLAMYFGPKLPPKPSIGTLSA
jgi:hypothetical protein